MNVTREDVTMWARLYPVQFKELVGALGFAVSNAEWGRKLEVQYQHKEKELVAEFALNRRDQFAMAALTGLLSNTNAEAVNSDGWSWRTGTLAGDAYQFADEMLEARKQESGT